MERPILFNTDMVRAILEGRKTQTRRIIKPQPKEQLKCVIQHEVSGYAHWVEASQYGQPYPKNIEYFKSIEVGDTLWVRETWADLRGLGFDKPFTYLADCLNKNGVEDADGKRCRLDYGVKWKPSIHMPRAAARIFLKVTNVRVERLQDITHHGVISEGIAGDINANCKQGDRITPRNEFINLWDSIYNNWKENPWVWVIEFERMV